MTSLDTKGSKTNFSQTIVHFHGDTSRKLRWSSGNADLDTL